MVKVSLVGSLRSLNENVFNNVRIPKELENHLETLKTYSDGQCAPRDVMAGYNCNYKCFLDKCGVAVLSEAPSGQT